MQSNLRFRGELESDVPMKVWELVLKMGISREINKELYVEEIRSMKARDKDGMCKRDSIKYVIQ